MKLDGINEQTNQVGYPRGWVCPKCGLVWAPHVNFCGCANTTPQPWFPPPFPVNTWFTHYSVN